MAGNTIMTAKNSFLEGLVMDFAPDNTQANVLTSALNATLLTFNGNEMSLLNDMGNGRVETAHLPEGYIPVGTCEFGDIIYIVSYNPLTDKAQIGCFPSPERNISSEEDNNNTNVSLSANDFQELNENGEPTGDLKTSSVKKILFQNDLHPGDKYVIYAKDIDMDEVKKTLSDHGNSDHIMGKFPKFLKVRIVSIEESGKITYIDSNTKWYNNHYYIQPGIESNDNLEPDLDSYQSLVNSAYNTFASKVSGKLALLIELEKITGFSHSWEVYETSSDDVNNTYNIYFNFSWTTDNMYINPSKVCITESYWNETNVANKFNYYVYNLDEKQTLEQILKYDNSNPHAEIEITRLYKPEEKNLYSYKDVNNIYSNIDVKPIVQVYEKITYLPICGTYGYVDNVDNVDNVENVENKLTKSDDVINNFYNYPITKLFWENLTIPVKRNGLDVNLTDAVYNYEITPAMPYGLLREFSLKGQIDFSKIGKENIKLHTWKYYNTSDTCTLTWGMDAYTSPGKVVSKVVFSFYDNEGLVATLTSDNKRSYNGIFTEYFNFDVDGSHPKLKSEKITNEKNLDVNKVIKSNSLYLVKIDVYQSFKQANGMLEETNNTLTEYRWFWTNGIFNKYYNLVSDFDELDLVLDLDCDVSFSSNENWKIETTKQPVNIESLSLENLNENIYYNKQEILGDNNINLKLDIGLLNNYNTFVVSKNSKFNIDIILAEENIENVPELPEYLHTEYSGVNPDLIPYCNYENKKDGVNYMKLTGGDSIDSTLDDAYYSYITLEGLEKSYKKGTIVKLENKPIESEILLKFEAEHYSKYCGIAGTAQNTNKIVRPFLYNVTDLHQYGLEYDNTFYFNKMFFGAIDNEYDTNKTVTYTYSIVSINPDEEGLYLINDVLSEGYKEYSSTDVSYILLNKDVTNNAIKENLPVFFPFGIGYNANQLSEYGDATSGNQTNWDKWRNHAILIESDYSTESEDWYIINREPKQLNYKLRSEDTYNSKYSGSSLGGALALQNSSGDFIVTPSWTKDAINDLGSDVAELLLSLYYVSDDIDTTPSKYMKSLIYLKENYTSYTRDIIIDILNSDQITININDISLDEYITNLKVSQINNNNVTVKFNLIRKIYPLTFNIYYIIPDITYIGDNNKTKVVSCYEQFNGYSNQNLLKNLIYGIKEGLNGNIQLIPIYNLQDYQALDTVEIKDEHFVCEPKAFSKKLNNNLKDLLTISNGLLCVVKLFSTTLNTYKLKTCGTQDKENIHIAGFPKDYKLL